MSPLSGAVLLTPSALPVGDDMDYLPHRAPAGDDVEDELCAMFDESSQCTIVLPEECLGYGLVVPFLACRFALWFRIMKTSSAPLSFPLPALVGVP